jgi:ribosomal protein S18 acetylase RimI-like enzyme
VNWKDNAGKALYMDRLGVNVNYSGQGIGSYMLTKATGVYDEVIDDELILHEYGYEILL